jgi:GNAT superfamily N-acetyltransferase
MPRYAAAGLAVEPVRSVDVPVLMEMLGELAEYLRGRQNFVTTEEELNRALLSEPPVMEALLSRVDGHPAGFVTWFEEYKIFSGRRAMRIDYLYVRPEFRNRPLAMLMLMYALQVAKTRGYRYVEGVVLDWNTPARRMYQALRARELDTRIFSLDLGSLNLTKYARGAYNRGDSAASGALTS